MGRHPDFDPPSLLIPGEGMTIERLPLPDDFVRLQALKAASRIGAGASGSSPVNSRAVIAMAKEFEDYIREDSASEDYHDEETLNKVRRILENVGSVLYTGDDILNKLQNEGILFRERKK